MYPDLSYILHDIFGTEPDNWFSVVQSFGMMLALAFLASALLLRSELKRKYEEGLLPIVKQTAVEGEGPKLVPIATQALLGFVLGFKGLYIYQNSAAFKQDTIGTLLSTEGVFWAGLLGALIFGAYQFYKMKRSQLEKPKKQTQKILPQDKVWDITMVAAIFGVLGAKIFAVFESTENIKAFFQDPLGTLLSGSGLAIYGGLIIAFIAVFTYVKKLGWKPIHIMDAVAPALMIGYAVGRIGCQISGDGDWGVVAGTMPDWWFLPEWLWSYDYPHNVLDRGIPIENCNWEHCSRLSQGVYPTPLYETIISLIFTAILWLLRKRMKIAGTLFCLYLLMNGVERFFIEKIRVNDKIDLGFAVATQAEIISLLLVVTGIGLWIYFIKRNKNQDQSKA